MVGFHAGVAVLASLVLGTGMVSSASAADVIPENHPPVSSGVPVSLAQEAERTLALAEADLVTARAELGRRDQEQQRIQQRCDRLSRETARLNEAADVQSRVAEEAAVQAGRVVAALARSGPLSLSQQAQLTKLEVIRSAPASQLPTQLHRAERAAMGVDRVVQRARNAQAHAKELSRQAHVSARDLSAMMALHTTATQTTMAAQTALATAQQQAERAHIQLAELRHKALPADSGWVLPVSGTITDGFGVRPRPCAGCSANHKGLDFAATCGTPVYAAATGTVIFAGRDGGYGNFLLLTHLDSIDTGYAHLQDHSLLVKEGQHVTVGDLIARVGSTGTSTGCHLHFEIRHHSQPINPLTFLRDRGLTP